MIKNNESYLHLTGLAGPSGCVCVNLRMRLSLKMGAFLGILKQSSYTLAWHVRCRYKRDDFFIGDELSSLSEREFKLHSLPPSRGLEIRNRSRVSLCIESRVLPNGHRAMRSKLTHYS